MVVREIVKRDVCLWVSFDPSMLLEAFDKIAKKKSVDKLSTARVQYKMLRLCYDNKDRLNEERVRVLYQYLVVKGVQNFKILARIRHCSNATYFFGLRSRKNQLQMILDQKTIPVPEHVIENFCLEQKPVTMPLFISA